MLLFAARRDGEASRHRILVAVQTDPGVHVSELVARTGLSWHTVAYHLRILVRQHAVAVEKENRERRVFPAGIPALQRAWLAALRGPRAAEVLRMVAGQPGLGISALSRRIGFSEKIVRRQVANLARAGLLERRGQLRPVYEVSARAAPDLAPLLRDGLHRPPDPLGDRGLTGPHVGPR
jgi:predicted transcriptional regulator